MAFDETFTYLNLTEQLSRTNTTQDIVTNLTKFGSTIYKSDLEDRYSAPMLGIGIYVAVVSLFCILAMAADLLHGFRSKKLWFPSKYFPINAFTLAGIAVAMKLPVDLSGSMPGDVDQVAKLGSMAFMCTMMANFLPCLATMDSIELLTNVTALAVLVITFVVNVCIQIQTGVVGKLPNGTKALDDFFNLPEPQLAPLPQLELKDIQFLADLQYTVVAIFYVVVLLLLLIIHVSSTFAILKSKEIIELKYQQGQERASSSLQQSTEKLLTVKKVQQHVTNCWIMAQSGSPQFIIACSATTTASGVICVLTCIFHIVTMIWTIIYDEGDHCASDYKWSTLVILIVQSIGVVLGTVAPVFRCFAFISFKLTIESVANHIKVFKVEKYWTQKLYEWKYGSISLPLLSISLPFGNHKLKVVIRTLKNIFLHFCIILQVGVVIGCKIIELIPFLLVILVFCLKWLFRAVFCLRGMSSDQNLEVLQQYVLQLEEEIELAKSTLKRHLKSLNGLIQKSEKKQPENLKKLILDKSTKGFQGVRMFDNDDHHDLCSPSNVECRDCWSLPVVTLTTIAITLPNIEKVKVKSLLKSVREGLEYVTLVEETLNATDDYKSVQKAAKRLWEEVDFCHKWLGIKLEDITSQVNTDASQVDATRKIVTIFLEKAKNFFLEKAKNDFNKGRGTLDDELKLLTLICAKSMSRVTETIIRDEKSHERLFDELSSWIADIMAACLTNLPQAIATKCHTSVIERREASVEAAAKLLGETKEIINTLQGPLQHKWHAYLSMPTKDLPFIDKWPAHLSEP